jgi:hypothetical protein
VSEFERWGLVVSSFRLDVLILLLRNCLTGLVADGDVVVVEGVRDVSGVRVRLPLVNEECGGGPGL